MRLTKETKEERIKKIVEASEISTSYREICRYVELVYPQVKRLFEEFPEIKEKVDKNIGKNKRDEKKKATKRTEKTTSNGKERKARTYKRKEKEQVGPAKENLKEEKQRKAKGLVILDATIVWIPNILDMLEKEYSEYDKAFTNEGISELKKLQKSDNLIGKTATHLLWMLVRDDYQIIAEELPKEDILQYCKSNPGAILLTADTLTAAKARNLKIRVKLLTECTFELEELIRMIKTCRKYPITTFQNIEERNSQLILKKFNYKNKRTFIVSNGKVICEGVYRLKIGDNIYLCSQRPDGVIVFIKYRVISLKKKNNVNVMWTIRLEESQETLDEVYEDYKKIFQLFVK